MSAGDGAELFLRLSCSAWRSFTSDARKGMAVGFERIIASRAAYAIRKMKRDNTKELHAVLHASHSVRRSPCGLGIASCGQRRCRGQVRRENSVLCLNTLNSSIMEYVQKAGDVVKHFRVSFIVPMMPEDWC